MLDDVRFEQVDEIRLSADQDKAIAKLIADTYRADFRGHSFCHQRHHVRFLAWHDNELVAHLAVLFRSIRIADEQVDIMGIAEVATAKSARKRGIASTLVRQALDVARESTAEFVLLFGTENIYSAAGFQSKQNPMKAISLNHGSSGDCYTVESEPLMVAAVSSMTWDNQAEIDLLGSIF